MVKLHLVFHLVLLQASSSTSLAFLSQARSPSKAILVRPKLGVQPKLDGRPSQALSSPAGDGYLEPRIPDVVVDPDYKLSAAFAVVGVSVISVSEGLGGLVAGGIVALLATLFAVQATRLRFVFDGSCFELKAVGAVGSEDLRDSGENIVVGGANRWAYSSFVNWDFYPSADFPVLVYFKETQTPTADGSDGQIHFFPAIADAKALKEQFELRGCARVGKN